ncbi:histidine phosphatase family protein [Pseudonocardia sp. H11422]|uniref:histidine phosphatase family protein n=1 Tax=Pseudonocardia sp. H11422 TaxID=2835866 RepID=UPI001BDBEFF9|nr:histidine phosphatase family protein [Pseudonocardia sp. H11422]
MRRYGPAALWLVRHAESTGNLAREVAESGGAELLDLAERDADVPLSALGRQQASALGKWLAGLPAQQRPTVVMSSPYRRALDTAREATAALGAVPLDVDERLRDRELGILDLHTKAGIEARHPDESARRRRLGKFYYRPPGGESWADVALRLRSVLGDASLDLTGERVVWFTHEAPILLTRYILEELVEDELMTITRSTSLANCSVTIFEREPGDGLRLLTFNATEMLDEHGASPTAEPDAGSEPD